MPKGMEGHKGDKKKAQFSLKEKRLRKVEKRAAKHVRTITPESLTE